MNSAAVESITSRKSNGSRCVRQENAPSASPVSTGTPTIMKALNVYRSIPATRCRIEPNSGTLTRYPPPNIENGPQSPAIRPGVSCIIRFERQVYQAGSRVGALIEGSCRKVHPNATSRSAIAPIRTIGLDSRPRCWGSGICTPSSERSFVSAIGCGVPLVLLARADIGEAWEPRKDTRPAGAPVRGAQPRASGRQSRPSISVIGNAAENTGSERSASGSGGASSGFPCSCV